MKSIKVEHYLFGPVCSTVPFCGNWRRWKAHFPPTWGCWSHGRGECWPGPQWRSRRISNVSLDSLYVTTDFRGNTEGGICAFLRWTLHRWCPNAKCSRSLGKRTVSKMNLNRRMFLHDPPWPLTCVPNREYCQLKTEKCSSSTFYLCSLLE